MGKLKERIADDELEIAAEEPVGDDAGDDANEVPDEVRWFVRGARALIGARSTTQAQVARDLGGGAPYLSNVLSLEQGRMRKFRFHYACLVAKALDTDLIALMKLGRTIDESLKTGEEGDES